MTDSLINHWHTLCVEVDEYSPFEMNYKCREMSLADITHTRSLTFCVVVELHLFPVCLSYRLLTALKAAKTKRHYNN